MIERKKKLLLLVLTIVMVLSLMPLTALAASFTQGATITGKKHALYRSDGSLSSYQPSEIRLYSIDGKDAYCVECGVSVGSSYAEGSTLAEACANGSLHTAAGGGGRVSASSTKAEKWVAYVTYYASGLPRADIAMGVWMALDEAIPVSGSYDNYDALMSTWNAFESFLQTDDAAYIGSNTRLYTSGSGAAQVLCVFTPYELPKNGNIEIVKSSANPAITNGNSCYSLQGAVYDIYNSRDEKVGSITTDANGRGRIDNLAAGSYYAVEVSAPKGYALDSSRQNFSVTAGQITTLSVSDKPQNDPAGILLSKLDSATGENIALGDGSLANAEFTVKYYDGFYSTAAELAGKTPERTWIFGTDGDGMVIFDESYFLSGDELFRVSGQLTLPLGTITIQETKAPEGYLLNDELFIRQITADSFAESVNTYNEPEISEQVEKGSIKITKVLTDQMNPTSVEVEKGAEFQVYLKSAGSYEAASELERDILVTDEKGEAASKELPFGTYILHQTKGQPGYYMTADMEVSIAADGEIVQRVLNNARKYMYLNIQKVDAETKKAIPADNVVFKLKNSAGEYVSQEVRLPSGTVVYEEFQTGADGIAQIPFVLPADTYTIVEIASPDKYLLGEEVSFTLDTEEHGASIVVTVEYENTPQKGKILIQKTGEQFCGVSQRETEYGTVFIPVFQEGKIAGAVFDIIAAEDIIVGGDTKALKGEVVDTITTSDQEDWSDELYLGNYALIEKSTPYGYVLNAEPINITLDTDDPTQAVIVQTVDMKNEWQKTAVSVYKEAEVLDVVEGEDGTLETVLRVNPGEGFTFGLFAGEDFSLNGEVALAKDSMVALADTDENGKITFDAQLPHGSYYIKEIATKEGYILSEQTYSVDFSYQGGEVAEIKVDLTDNAILNPLNRTEVTITKEDLTGETPLAGATIEVTDKTTGKVVYRAITDESGQIPDMIVLVGHTYEFVETLAPETYERNTKTFTFTVEEDGTVTGDTVIRDDFARYELLKTQEDGETPIVGAVFAVYDEQGQEIMQAASDKNGRVVFERLPFGELVIREIEVTPGYQVSNEEITIMVDGSWVNSKEPTIFTNKTLRIGTYATAADGTKKVTASTEATIIDTVRYENLNVGRDYTLKGILMDKATGQPLLVNGEQVTSETSFRAVDESGEVAVVFTFDASALAGTQTVIFETLYENGIEVTTHADIADEGQTIEFVEVPKPPKTGDTSNLIFWAGVGSASMAVLALLMRKKRKVAEK